jgi:hypothetical protein
MKTLSDTSPEEQAAECARQERRRERRAHLRAENHMRPRCAGCEAEMLVFSARDVFTKDDLQQDGYAYDVFREEFRPGDILCFWCMNACTACGERLQWGQA